MTFIKKASAATVQPKQTVAPNFTPPPSSDGPFLRFDAELAKIKIVGATSDGSAHLESNMRLHLDLSNVQVGWLSFQNGGGEIVATDRDNPPPGAGQEGGPRWGAIVSIASPYPLATDDLKFERGIPAHETKTSSRAVLEALGAAHEQYATEASNFPGQIPVFDLVGWNKISGRAGRKTYFAPMFELVGFVPKIDTPLVEQPEPAT